MATMRKTLNPEMVKMLKKLLNKDKIGKGRKSSGPTTKKKLKKKPKKITLKGTMKPTKAGFKERVKRMGTPRPTKLY